MWSFVSKNMQNGQKWNRKLRSKANDLSINPGDYTKSVHTAPQNILKHTITSDGTILNMHRGMVDRVVP